MRGGGVQSLEAAQEDVAQRRSDTARAHPRRTRAAARAKLCVDGTCSPAHPTSTCHWLSAIPGAPGLWPMALKGSRDGGWGGVSGENSHQGRGLPGPQQEGLTHPP